MSKTLSLTDLQTDRSFRVRLAEWLPALTGPFWALQSLGIAAVIGLWLANEPTPLWAGLLILIAGGLRIAIQRWSRHILFDAALTDQALLRARLLDHALIRLEGRESAAAFAALVTEKLPLLIPYQTRYRPAMRRAMIQPLVLIALSACVSWIVALLLLVAVPLIPVFMALIGRAAKQASEKQLKEISGLNSLLSDRLAAAVDLRLLGARDRAVSDFADRAKGLREQTMEVLRIAFLSSTVLELLAAIGVAMIAVFVGFTLLGEIGFGSWSGLGVGEGIFLLLLAPEVFQPMRDLAAAWHDKAAAEAAGDEIVAGLSEDDAAVLGRGIRTAPLPGPAQIEVLDAQVLRGEQVVALPRLTLAAGDCVALSGPSGSGKTSTLMALAGLVPLCDGQIRVADQELTALSADAWRRRVVWCPQSVRFPDVTLRVFLDPTGHGGDPTEALARAGAEAIVARLPGGLDARLGETGAGVSGGEARRLLLARALLAKPDVLLADEPTADLDPAMVQRIIETLRGEAARGALVLVASHDPVVLAAMDKQVSLT